MATPKVARIMDFGCCADTIHVLRGHSDVLRGHSDVLRGRSDVLVARVMYAASGIIVFHEEYGATVSPCPQGFFLSINKTFYVLSMRSLYFLCIGEIQFWIAVLHMGCHCVPMPAGARCLPKYYVLCFENR